MVREDSITLNVMAEQIAAQPSIEAVTVFALDGTVLAAHGSTQKDPRGAEFTHPIQLADATAGFVKVTVSPIALQQSTVAASLKSALLPWLLAALGSWGAIAWFTRAPRPDRASQTSRDSRGNTADTGDAGLETTSMILLVVHLFNGKEMPASRRDALLAASRGRIEAVIELYHGTQQPLSDTSIGVLFDSPDPHDREFQAACAALVIARLCDQPGGGRYRYSLQHAELPINRPGYLLDAVQSDALLHAALADDNTIALSAAYARDLPRPERLELTREHSPALGSLHLSDASDYFLLAGANPATEKMLHRQMAILTR